MKKKSYIAIMLFCLLFLIGCSSLTPPVDILLRTTRVTLRFHADNPVNEGVLLPVDIIVADASLMGRVLEIGPEAWFGHSARHALLQDKLYSLAISGGETKTVKIKINDNVKKFIIYGDYETQTDRESQQLTIAPERWSYSYDIRIKKEKMEFMQ